MNTIIPRLDSLAGARPAFFVRTRTAAPPKTVEAIDTPSISLRLLIVFILLMYSSIAVIYPALNALRPALLVAAAAGVMMFVELAASRRAFRFTWPESYMLLAFLGVAVVSSFDALYARQAYLTTTDFAKVVIVYVLIENLLTNEKRLRMLMMTMVVGGLIPAIGTITYYARGILIEGRGAWEGVFKNPNENAYAMVILVPLAAVLAVKSNWPVRIALAAATGLFLVAIFLTYSRSGLLGLLTVLGFMVGRCDRRRCGLR